MFPRANELNMVSDNGVSNSKDLKGGFTTITDSTSYPKTPYYMDKSTDRENSVTAEAESFGRTEAEGVSNCSPRGGALAGDGKTAVNLGCFSITEVSSATLSS